MVQKDQQVIAGDRASHNPTSSCLPPGGNRAPLKGLELLPEVMGALGFLKEDPDTLKLSRAGAERNILALAQNHLDAQQEKKTKGGWKIVADQLSEIDKAAEALHAALNSTCGLTCIAILRTGGQQDTSIWLDRLNRLRKDVSNAFAVVPASNRGDAVAVLNRLGTDNEMLVLGCQNILHACGKSAGAGPRGILERLAKLVKRLALGADGKAGGIHAAAESLKVKGRFNSDNLREEALWLIVGDLESRNKTNSSLFQQAQAELTKIAEGDINPGKNER